MTPERLSGAWRRISIAVDGAPPAETADVVWLQAGDAFADLRVPRRVSDPPACFTGSTSWEEPNLRWVHHLDLDESGADSDDVGALSEDGGDLVEVGAFEREGRTVAYEERWRRLAGSDDPRTALVRDDGLGQMVVAGHHALVVVDDRSTGGAFGASYRTHTTGAWSAVSTVGAGAASLPRPPEARGRPGNRYELDDHRWHVIHAGAVPATPFP